MGIKSNYNKRNIMKIKMTASILVLALSLGAAELRVKPEEAVICAPPQEKKSGGRAAKPPAINHGTEIAHCQ